MNCCIKRYNEKIERHSYFARNIGKNINHWVQLRIEAKMFDTIKEAKRIIKHYKLKNCEVEICQKKD